MEKVRKRRAADVEKVRKKKSCRCGESKKRAVDVEKVRKRRAVDVEKVRKKKSCRCEESKNKNFKKKFYPKSPQSLSD